MWDLKKTSGQTYQSRNRLLDAESKQAVARGEGAGKGEKASERSPEGVVCSVGTGVGTIVVLW